MIEVVGDEEVAAVSEDAETTAMILESLAEKVRAGAVVGFRVKWDGGPRVRLTTDMELGALTSYMSSGEEQEGNEDDGQN